MSSTWLVAQIAREARHVARPVRMASTTWKAGMWRSDGAKVLFGQRVAVAFDRVTGGAVEREQRGAFGHVGVLQVGRGDVG